VVTVSDGRSRVLRPRGPGYVFAAGATAVLLLIGFVALNASQPPPPTVAEFAPAALDQIKDAPDRQSSDVGDAPGGAKSSASPGPSPGASGGPAPSPTPSGTVVNAQFHCVGNPPRQIEDPQSPPCVPGWEGDNGGATSFGVTKDEIRVAAPYGTFLTGDPTPQWQAMVNFFNRKFEFYGRKIILQPLAATGDNFAYPVPADMQKDAAKVYAEKKSFASLGYPDRKGAEHHYYEELARHKVISVIGRETAKGTESYFKRWAPYQWNRGTAIDTQMKNYGRFLCNEWVGKPLHYGGPAWPFTPPPNGRKFAILVTEATDGTVPDIKPLKDNLKACGVVPFVLTSPETKSQQDGVNPMLSMVDQKITSIICVCDVGSARDFLNGAEAQSYRPEWLMGTYINNDVDNSFSTSPPTQTANVFGISYLDKFLPIQQSWWYQAMREGDSSVPAPANAGPIAVYQDLLLLASGIQMAGPHLTPQTFADALHRTVFPNPGADRGPYFQGRVGFENDTFSMRQTASTYWYDSSQGGVDDPSTPGRVCHVRHGIRYAYEEWPKEDPPYKKTSCT
jgi:hypothetical protein